MVSLQGNICEYTLPLLSCSSNPIPSKALCPAFTSDVIQVLRMDGVAFTGDVSIMTKLMSLTCLLERGLDEDLLLQTKETAEGFRVATRGLLTMQGGEGAEMCRAAYVYSMEFEMQARTCLSWVLHRFV